VRILLWLVATLVLAVGSTAAWVAWWPHSDLTKAGLHTEVGNLTSGNRFGLRPGMPWQEADQTIRSQFEPAYVLWWVGTEEEKARGAGSLPSSPVLSGPSEVSYRDKSWRNGVITLRLYDGIVTEVGWSFGGPFYIDL
jgi:hypothetical protein